MKVLLHSILFVFVGFLSAEGQIITTVAGGATGHGGYWGDGGPATAAELGLFAGLLIDEHGNIYISDGNNQRIRKVDGITGIISTVVGTGIAGYSGDGLSATLARINGPVCISLDHSGNLYFYDALNNRIRKVNLSTNIISTFAGNGTFGSTGDGGPATAATIDGGDMAWDTVGNLFLTSTRKIRKIDPSGIISIFAGNGLSGVTGEGVPATATYIAETRGLAIDSRGNLFLADSSMAVRKIAASTGLITRVGGTGDNVWTPYLGDGIPATVSHFNPFDISLDGMGTIYVSDYGNSKIEIIDTFGIIHTVAGTGISGFSGDGGPATAAQISYPENVVLDGCGNIYIADFNNRRVRKVTYPPILTTPTISLSGASSCPAGCTVTVTASVGSAGASYLIHWFNHGIEFTTTTVPSVTYTKPPGTDTITARIVPTGWGCWDSTTSSQHIVSTDVTGVSSVSEPCCMVYPNPAHTTLTAATPWNEGTLAIYNTIGQTVLAKQFYKRGIPVNVGNLPAGIYLLKITGAENETVITRFIKQ
jgi:sugar lactone lactonase YvrE